MPQDGEPRTESELDSLLRDAGSTFHEAVDEYSPPPTFRGPWRKALVILIAFCAVASILLAINAVHSTRIVRHVVALSKPGRTTVEGTIASPREIYLRLSTDGNAPPPKYVGADWQIRCRRGSEEATRVGSELEPGRLSNARTWPLPITIEGADRCWISAIGTRDGDFRLEIFAYRLESVRGSVVSVVFAQPWRWKTNPQRLSGELDRASH